MPNVEPQNLPIMPGGPFGGSCGTSACVEITATPAGFLFTSTIDGNDGAVVYTAAETVTFLADVKAGKWDAVESLAARLAESETVTA